ncbi:MAG TPA: dTMP kinase [Campylobacterales bacterium]|nr:dTMP kinase [Campylobacterales bacterium]
MYIVFEGIDFVGKTTQIEKLKKEFPDFIYTREPGGTQFGKKVRDILLHDDFALHHFSEFLLFLADRSEHYRRVLKPNLEAGKVVISDRSIISGMAYAKSNGGIEEETILDMNLMSVEKTLPNLVIFLTISRDELMRRKSQELKRDNIEIRGIDYSLSVQDNISFWLEKLEIETLQIDSSNSVEAIFNTIRKKIEEIT